MERNDENVAWAIGMLADKLGWQNGFPTNEKHLIFRGESFLKLVHNKPIREVIQSNRWKLMHEKLDLDKIKLREEFAATGATPEMNDAEWILNYFAEHETEFPAPVTLRRMYQNHILPWDGLEVPDIPDAAYA